MHLVVYISAHGFGHAAQSCAALNAMADIRDDLDVTIVSQVSPEFLASRLAIEYELINRQTDIGLVMRSGIEIDLPASREAYRQWHAQWPKPVQDEKTQLAALKPDAVLSDIAYTPLAAARELDIPAVALCCLNWGSVYQHYFSDMPESGKIVSQILAAYHQADVFLTTPPVWDMPEIRNQKQTALLVNKAQQNRVGLRRMLGLDESRRLVLVGLGGVATRLPLDEWPERAEIHWLIPASWNISRPDVSTIESTGMTFSNLIASVDLVLGKIGYGLVSECAVNGTSLLYIERPDWPEDRPFSAWLNAHGRCAGVGKQRLESGDVVEAIEALLSRPAPEPPEPDARQVAWDCLEYLLHDEH